MAKKNKNWKRGISIFTEYQGKEIEPEEPKVEKIIVEKVIEKVIEKSMDAEQFAELLEQQKLIVELLSKQNSLPNSGAIVNNNNSGDSNDLLKLFQMNNILHSLGMRRITDMLLFSFSFQLPQP